MADKLQEQVNKILDDPACWDQSKWHCGSTHCIAGLGQIAAGKVPNDKTCAMDAAEYYGLTPADASWLFAGNRTLEEIHGFAADRAGYNRAGYDLAGYDREGYDLAGYDREGYNRAGYDREGYRAGYNWEGYDREGYNRAGNNRAGKQLSKFE